MQRVASSIEEEMIIKAIQEETPWEKLPKRLKLFLSTNEEYLKRWAPWTCGQIVITLRLNLLPLML